MRFEARELKPYAEPVEPKDLKLGKTYFGVQFLDERGLVPVLEPKVFVGRDLDPEGEGRFYFQDYASYQRGVRFENFDNADSKDAALFETGCEKHVFDYERALDVLLRCALSRKEAFGRK